jgi:hypothetical protein
MLSWLYSNAVATLIVFYCLTLRLLPVGAEIGVMHRRLQQRPFFHWYIQVRKITRRLCVVARSVSAWLVEGIKDLTWLPHPVMLKRHLSQHHLLQSSFSTQLHGDWGSKAGDNYAKLGKDERKRVDPHVEHGVLIQPCRRLLWLHNWCLPLGSGEACGNDVCGFALVACSGVACCTCRHADAWGSTHKRLCSKLSEAADERTSSVCHI